MIKPPPSGCLKRRFFSYCNLTGFFVFGLFQGKNIQEVLYQQVDVVESPTKGRQPIKKEVQIKKSNERISGDVAMKEE